MVLQLKLSKTSCIFLDFIVLVEKKITDLILSIKNQKNGMFSMICYKAIAIISSYW